MVEERRFSKKSRREEYEEEKKKKKKKEEEVKEEEEENDESAGELETYAVIPPNGGWGWVVVFCAFYCNVIVDGIQLTFGVFLTAISKTFEVEVAEVALAGSLMFGIHLLMGPVCAGFSRVFGLRPVAIAGSLICCFGVGISYFATGHWFLYISFGVIGGVGLGLVYMNSLVITSVYFTSLMPIAIGIVVCGTGVGTMVFAALGQHLLYVTTWQNSFLMQAALAGSMALAAASFRPLKPVKVQLSPPSSPLKLESTSERGEPSSKRTVFIKTGISTTKTSLTSLQTVQSGIWNFMEEAVISKKSKEKYKCRCSFRRKKEESREKSVLVLSEIKTESQQTRRRSYVEKGRMHELDDDLEYIRSSTSVKPIYTRIDIEKKPKNKAWVALRRTIAAMLDCGLMASCTFIVFTASGALQVAGFLIVFIYEKERCISMGFSEDMSVYFVIFLGGSNMFWRLFLGGLATLPKINYWALAVVGIVIGGLVTIISGFYHSIYFHFVFCFFFGLGIATFAVFRIVLLVDLVGVEKIENATGINLLFMGILCIASPPIFGWLTKLTHNYDIVFILTGILVVISGLMLTGLKKKKK